MYVIDLNEEQYPAQLTTTWEGDLNGNQNLSATIKPSKVNLQYIHDIAEMWRIVDDDDTEYKIIYCKRRGSGNLLTVDIKALPKYQDDLNNQRIHRRIDEHLTANAFFNIVFHEKDELGNASGYNFILNGTFEAQQWEGLAEGSTRLEMLEKGLNRYKSEFRIVGNTFYIENQIGNDTSHRYEHRLNASNIVQEIDANEFYTYAKGYGDYGDGEGGEDWRDAKLIREYTSPLAKIPAIGLREAPPIKNGNITTRATMDEQLKILVNESLKISVTADIHDLTRQGYPIAQSNLGDRVFLIDPRIGFDEEIRVVRKSITRNWKREIIDLKLTFGAPGLVKRHQSSLNAAAKNITELLAGRIKLPFSVLDNATAEATKALQRMVSQLTITENGSLMAVDKINPNNVVILNAAGLGVSDDGGQTFENAITGQGINGRAIIARSVLADVIAGGVLTSLNDNFELNMNTGNMTSRNASWTLGNGARINFNDPGNKITYRKFDSESGFSRASGLGVGDLIGGRYPFVYVGTNGKSELDTLDEFYTGLIVVPSAAMSEGGTGSSSMNGYRFEFRNKATGYTKGFRIDLFGSNPGLIPLNGSEYNYTLGNSNNLINLLYTRGIRTVGGFEVRNNAVIDIGWRLSTIQEGGRVSLRGLNMGAYNYDLGSSESYNRFFYGYISHLRPSTMDSGSGVGSSDRPYRWGHIQTLTSDTIYGTLAGPSSKDVKMAIEDVSGQQAFDYFDMMEVKSFFYKESDITNKYNRKVSPVIEQLDPVMENLYKASEGSLDINSNLFLLVQAFKHYVSETNIRLEALENGAERTTGTVYGAI